MSQELLVYEWECPICSQTKLSLTPLDKSAVRGQAVNAFRNHVSVTDGGGHGRKGEFPPGFDPSDALDHIEFTDDVEAPTREESFPV